MLRVLIADDEDRICKLIQILADWKRLDMEVVGIAANGQDALTQVNLLTPDILITDIRMPGLDGLALISRAKEIAPELEVIIISGYAQFDYAQTAIQYGVGDYLLKPINKEALNNTLDRMAQRCHARKKSQSDMDRLRRSSLDDQKKLRGNLVSDLLHGRYNAPDVTGLEETYHFIGRDDTYQVFTLKMDYDIDRFSEQSLAIVRNKAEDVFAPVLSAYCGDFLLEFRNATMYGVMNYPSAMRSTLRKRLRDCLNQLVALKNLFGSIAFSLALGQAVSQPDAMQSSFDNARDILAERLIEGTGRLLEGTVTPSNLREMNLLARYAQAAAYAIDVLGLEDAESAADALSNMVSSVPNLHGWELLELVRGAGVVFITRLDVENRDQVQADFENRCGQCHTAADLFDCLKKLQREELMKMREARRSQDGQPIRIAKQYIQKHFSEPITLEEVSSASGFSVNYFSTLFKKETGEGFARYLTRVRIEEAKGMLRETRLPVQEICKRVGYGDSKHFTRTFRSETGLTPGEFRKLYG